MFGTKNIYARFISTTPDFYLYGDVGKDAITKVNGVDTSGITGYPAEGSWTGSPAEALKLNTGSDGVYSITIKTTDNNFNTDGSRWDINIGLYQGSKSSQRGFYMESTNTWYNTVGADYEVPALGIDDTDNMYVVNGTGSIVLAPDTEYTIYIDQTQPYSSAYPYGKITIVTDKADIKAVARYQRFDITQNPPTYGAVANAPAAIGTATAKPALVNKGQSSTLTATTMNDNYDFIGWFTSADCTGTAYKTSESFTEAINSSTTYYALFREKEHQQYNYSVVVDSSTPYGSVGAVTGTGIVDGDKVYSGGTLRFTATPDATYMIDTVTATNGAVAVNRTNNAVTVSNITADTAVTVKFKKIPTYALTINLDTATYGKVQASYTNASGAAVTDENITTSGTVINVQQGVEVTLKAVANTTGDKGDFNGWTLESGKYQRSKTTPLSGSTIKIMPSADQAITAAFVEAKPNSTWYINFTSGPSGFTTGNKYFKEYTSGTHKDFTASSSNKMYVQTVTLPVGTYYYQFHDDYRSYQQDSSQEAPSPSIEKWVRSYSTNKANNNHKLEITEAGEYTFYARWGGQDGNINNDPVYYLYVDVVKGSGSSSGDDSTDTEGKAKLYVLDGVRTNGDFGTSSFGTTVISSAKSGVVKTNYYDATDAEQVINTDAGHSEGGLIYYYDESEDLNFRVTTTIADNHKAIGVRAFVMNGMTFPAKKNADGTYYADITLVSNYYKDLLGNGYSQDKAALEVIPVYYNTLMRDSDYIKFYVDPSSLGDTWGRTLGYSLWYEKTSEHGMEGGYPGQPLMSDGNLLYGYFPKYYVGVNATELPEAKDYNKFSGVLLTDLAEHNETHKDVLQLWGVANHTKNKQSFDYLDPFVISNLGDIDMIKFETHYNTNYTNTRYTMYGKQDTVKTNSNNTWPTDLNSYKPTGENQKFELLKDIDGKPVNIFNESKSSGDFTGDNVYVISVGNQTNSDTYTKTSDSTITVTADNKWDTTWVIFDSNYNKIAMVHPYELVDPTSALQTTLAAYKNSKVYILYERETNGTEKSSVDNGKNTGVRIDGRWLYSRSSDDTTLRLRVATKDANGNLTFMQDGINWAEIGYDAVTGLKENDYTKILNLSDRTTEVTAKINPVGYKIQGMYMQKSSYNIGNATANTGFSSAISDYDNLNVSGTATSFTNTRDNRMLIVLEKIDAANLVVFHQMYGGSGAHKIPGFFYTQVDLYNAKNGTKINPAGSANKWGVMTNKQNEFVNFTGEAQNNSHYYLKITLRTVMSGTATFYQWYANDHNGGYNEIDSTEARGSADPVEKVLWISVDDLYETDAQTGNVTLKYQNLDYYSDLQAHDTININHLLLPETVTAGLSGVTYNKVTVVDSTGAAVSGGSYAAQTKTTTVESSFITEENANNSYQIKIEIWTAPTSPAAFDSFYRDTTNAMTTGAVNGIAYTTGQTYGDYQKATVMIPMSYFFEWTDDGNGNLIYVFDTDKKDVNLYSKLKTGGKYTIEYTYTSRLWGTQKYVQAGDITDDIVKYFNIAGDGSTGSLVATTKEEFLSMMAPYEDNFKQGILWKFTQATEEWLNGELTIRVGALIDEQDKTFKNLYNIPYATQLGNNQLTITAQKDRNGRPMKTSTADQQFDATYGHRYTLNNAGASTQFLYAVPEINSGSVDNPVVEYFQYWEVRSIDGSKLIRKCYSAEFNLTFYEPYKIVAIYGSSKTTPKDQSSSDAISASITFLENSRNQWNHTYGGNVGTDPKINKEYWNNYGDRVFSDFVLNFTYNDLMVSTTGKDGSDEYDTANLPIPVDDGRDAVTTYLNNGTKGTHVYVKENIDKTKIDNKNCIEYYYHFANVKHENMTQAQYLAVMADFEPEATTNKNYLYRAYATIKDATNTVVSVPVYFTIYDMASIENYSQNDKASGGKS